MTDLLSVRIEDAELCPRYTARVIRGVKIGPSPDWLKNTLEKVGVRSISNVVDVTNYVMLEIGQPLHAFDYHLLAATAGWQRPTIVVRRAAEGRKIHHARWPATPPSRTRRCSSPTKPKPSPLPASWAARIPKSMTAHVGRPDRERLFQTSEHPRHVQKT